MAELIPDIGSSRVQDIPAYNGGRDSTRIMMSTRAQLDQVTLPSYALGELMTGLWWVWVVGVAFLLCQVSMCRFLGRCGFLSCVK